MRSGGKKGCGVRDPPCAKMSEGDLGSTFFGLGQFIAEILKILSHKVSTKMAPSLSKCHWRGRLVSLSTNGDCA